jgi:ATP-dependent Lon protease
MEQSNEISQIPLFPLPLVLMPAEVLPLHIFEPRYRALLEDASASDNCFGVVLFDETTADGDRPAVGTIGTLAEIRESFKMDDGRSNILTVGIQRFEIIEYVETLDPYLVATVEFFNDDIDDSDELYEATLKLADRFRIALDSARAGLDIEDQTPTVNEEDPEEFAFIVCASMRMHNSERYSILKTKSSLERVGIAAERLDKLLDSMSQGEELRKLSKTNGHSKKGFDF